MVIKENEFNELELEDMKGFLNEGFIKIELKDYTRIEIDFIEYKNGYDKIEKYMHKCEHIITKTTRTHKIFSNKTTKEKYILY